MNNTAEQSYTWFRYLLFTLNLTILVQQLNAQQSKSDFESYTVKEGLSQNQVLSIAQDKRGFMWFGTEDGLNRFDGHDFKIFRHKENDPSTIVSNSVRVLFVDDDNTIWIGTDNEVCRYFPETEHIQHYPVDFTDEARLNGRYVSSIEKPLDGSLWISYIGSGIDIIYPKKKEIFHYTIHREDEYKLHTDMVSSLQFLADGSTVIGTYSGLQFLSMLHPPGGQLGFRLGLAILVGGFFYSVYQGRINFLKKQRNKLEQLVIIRTRELRRSNDEIQALLEEVAEQKDNIKNKNEELQQINEALGIQRDTLELKSSDLEKAEINLREINTNLEILVHKRTEKLNDTLQELEMFLYRASHDLRGPIASMLGLIEVAKMDCRHFHLSQNNPGKTRTFVP